MQNSERTVSSRCNHNPINLNLVSKDHSYRLPSSESDGEAVDREETTYERSSLDDWQGKMKMVVYAPHSCSGASQMTVRPGKISGKQSLAPNDTTGAFGRYLARLN